jgi:alcohol dehydrogenase
VKQLMFVERGRVEWREGPVPDLLDEGDALVRPLAVATCDIDRGFIDGTVRVPGPFPLGHEGIAEVVRVGPAVRSVRPGERVVVAFQLSCGTCERCRRGITSACSTVPSRSAFGMEPLAGAWGGFFSDLVRVPHADGVLVKAPAGVSPVAIASASDNLPDAYRTVAPHLASRPGADVLVVGGGAWSVGLYAAGMARALGAGRVDYVDHDQRRLDIAARLGAHVIDGPVPRKLGPYAITVDASARPEGLALALRSTEPYGVSTSVGIYFQPETPVPLYEMFVSGITFHTGRANARADIPAVLDLVASGAFDPTPVTTHTVGWEDAAEALLELPVKLVAVREQE